MGATSYKMQVNVGSNRKKRIYDMSEISDSSSGSHLEMQHEWEALPACPYDQVSNIIQIDRNRFIVSPYHYSLQKSSSLLEFNSVTLEWTVFAEYPEENFRASFHSIAYDPDTNKLFMCGEALPMTTVDLNKMEYYCKTTAAFKTERTPAMMIIDGQCHVICGGDNRHHLVWDDETQKYESLHLFEEYKKGLYNMGWVYVSSESEILMFGGFDHGSQKRYNAVIRYSLKHNKWSSGIAMLPGVDGMDSFGCILTVDQRYVIICGGFADRDWIKTIYVLDLSTMQFYESGVKCPQRGEYHGVLMDNKDKLIATGCLRMWQQKDDLALPLDLMELMIQYYVECYYLYLLNRGSGKHFRIDVNCILRCLPDF
eukprot:197459_1